jgi:hypothetical protein
MSESPNRAQRRHPERTAPKDGVLPPDRPQSAEHDIAKYGSQDEQSIRAKSNAHKKKTADKWNQ